MCIINKKKKTQFLELVENRQFCPSKAVAFVSLNIGVGSPPTRSPLSRWAASAAAPLMWLSSREQSESFFSRSCHLRAARWQVRAPCLAPSSSRYPASQACRTALALCCGCAALADAGPKLKKAGHLAEVSDLETHHQNYSHKPSESSLTI